MTPRIPRFLRFKFPNFALDKLPKDTVRRVFTSLHPWCCGDVVVDQAERSIYPSKAAMNYIDQMHRRGWTVYQYIHLHKNFNGNDEWIIVLMGKY
jgi:hypothetical protein